MHLGRRKTGWLLAALVVAALITPASASAINPVSFSQVGNMTIKRDAPGAARLPDGRVLIVGGYDGSDNLTSAEVFDPKTSTFTALGATLGIARYAPAAASLPDGRVLIAGGYDGNDDLTSAEVFNPSTGTFSPVGSMTDARELAGAAPLADGKVLVVGGFSSLVSNPVNTTEIFDPKTNTFSPGPTLSQPTYGPAVAAISGGRVLVAGGSDSTPFNSAFVFNPSSFSFSPAGSLPVAVDAAVGASLPQGRALVAGGDDQSVSDRYLNQALIFDPKTNAFSSTGIGTLIGKREEAAAVELADGRVLVAGGWDNGPLNTAEVLSVPSNAFKAKLKGRKIVFSVSNEGVASAADSSTKVATTAKKKKLVKTKSKHGGPGKIVVKVKLTKLGSAKLAEKGKLKIKAIYTPDGGLAAVKKLKLRAGK